MYQTIVMPYFATSNCGVLISYNILSFSYCCNIIMFHTLLYLNTILCYTVFQRHIYVHVIYFHHTILKCNIVVLLCPPY